MYVHEAILDVPLDEVSDAFLGLGREVLRVFAVDETLARAGFEKAVENVYRGAFPGAVLSQQAHDVAFGNDDVQIFVDECFLTVLYIVICL